MIKSYCSKVSGWYPASLHSTTGVFLDVFQKMFQRAQHPVTPGFALPNKITNFYKNYNVSNVSPDIMYNIPIFEAVIFFLSQKNGGPALLKVLSLSNFLFQRSVYEIADLGIKKFWFQNKVLS